MFDREIGLTGPEPEEAADSPALGVARVERQRTVDQPDHGTEVLAGLSQHDGGDGEDARVVLRHLERLPGEIAALAAGRLRFFAPTGNYERQMASRRPGNSRPLMQI